ncbi:MAG TPA: hypothetical protein VMV18_09595 [bacterium]|nr:hypothetical protein [bacterium]
MDGSLTHLRRYSARIRALAAMLEPGCGPEAIRTLAVSAGFAGAAEIFEREDSRRDTVDTARALLGRERALHYRVLLQASIGLVLVVSFATSNTPVTHAMAILAAFAAIPTWTLVAGAPDAVAAALFAAPLTGVTARQVQHSRVLAALALLLGAGVEPARARAVAERFVGSALPEAALARALSPSGSFSGKVALRAESEGALLRAASRLERSAAVRVRMMFLGIAAITLAAVFAPAWQQTLALTRGAKPVATHVEEEERPGIILLPATTSTGS